MNLKEFIVNFDPKEQIRVMHENEVVYEGEAEKLIKLLSLVVVEKSCKVVDGITQVNISVSKYK